MAKKKRQNPTASNLPAGDDQATVGDDDKEEGGDPRIARGPSHWVWSQSRPVRDEADLQ